MICNDPTRAGQFTSQLVADGNDVILTSLNLGVVGAFEAASDADGVLMTAKYTDKSNLGADTYLTSVIYDFTVMLDQILTSIDEGETGGYLRDDLRAGHLASGADQRGPGRRSTRSTRWSRTSRAARSRSSATSRRSNEQCGSSRPAGATQRRLTPLR